VSREHLIPGGSFRYPGRQYRVPASLRHLDLKLVGRTLVETNGNVSKAAERLGVDSSELRHLTWAKLALVELVDELAEQVLDAAEERLREAIRGADVHVAAKVSIWLLGHSEGGRARGYGSAPATSNLSVNVAVAMPHYVWADGTGDAVRDQKREDEGG
jgi:hypothetical protein